MIVAPQDLAASIEEVHAGAGRTSDPLIVVIGCAFVIVQPVLNGEPGGRTCEKDRAHERNIGGPQRAGI